MKVKLLKRLRKEAYNKIGMYKFMGGYYVGVREILLSKDNNWAYRSCKSQEEAYRHLLEKRREYIERKIAQMKDEKLNKKLWKV